MKYFGTMWNPNLVSMEIDKIPTPVGCECSWCDEPFVEGDQGLALPRGGMVLTQNEDGVFDKAGEEYTLYHRECFLRQITGSVGHQMGRCSCHGGHEEDPEGMSLREAAVAAAELFQKRNP